MKDNCVNIYRRTKLRTWFKEHKEYAKERQLKDGYTLPSESEIEEQEKIFSDNYLPSVENFEVVVGIPLIVIGESQTL